MVLASARKHGVRDADMLHAYRHRSESSTSTDSPLLVGTDDSGRMLEVGVAVGDGVEFIVPPPMPAREKFLR